MWTIIKIYNPSIVLLLVLHHVHHSFPFPHVSHQLKPLQFLLLVPVRLISCLNNLRFEVSRSRWHLQSPVLVYAQLLPRMLAIRNTLLTIVVSEIVLVLDGFFHPFLCPLAVIGFWIFADFLSLTCGSRPLNIAALHRLRLLSLHVVMTCSTPLID